jgi:hypothetical protein
MYKSKLLKKKKISLQLDFACLCRVCFFFIIFFIHILTSSLILKTLVA